MADLTVELRAWPTDTWAKVGIDPQAAAGAVIAGWQRGDLLGLRLGGLTAEEAPAMQRPAMILVRAQLGDRLGRQLAHAYWRWRHLPADAGPATCSSSGRQPAATAVSAADTNRPGSNRPDTDLLDTDRGSGSSSGQPRRPRCPIPQPPRHRRGVRLGRTAADRPPAVAVRRQDRACRIACLRWSSGQIDAASGERLSGCVGTGRGLPNTGSPHTPALRTPATAAGAWGHCDSGHAGQPTAGPSTTRQPCPTGTGPQCAAPGQHARLTARSVAWCSASIWSAPDGAGLLTLEASSVQTDPDGSRRIVWMIKRRDAESSAAVQTTGTIGRAGRVCRFGRGPWTDSGTWHTLSGVVSLSR